jgi:hypothetical protein
MMQFERPGDSPNLSRRRGQTRSRYPWLETYIAGIRGGALLTFVAGVGAALFMFNKGYNMEPGASPFASPELMAAGVIAGLVSFWELVTAFALTEFLRVMIDIEASARVVAQRG